MKVFFYNKLHKYVFYCGQTVVVFYLDGRIISETENLLFAVHHGGRKERFVANMSNFITDLARFLK